MATRLLLVRHGQTEWNAARRYQGHRDIPLSPAGVEQAERLAARLAKEPPRAVYASDLSRALQTATIIARACGIPVIPHEDLREIDVGEWEGRSLEEARELDPAGWARWHDDTENNPIPGGESFAQLRERVVRRAMQIVGAHPDDTVCIVSHAGPLRAIICDALGLDPRNGPRIVLANASVSAVSYAPGAPPRLLLTNDTCHLDAQP